MFPTYLDMYWKETQVILVCIGAIHYKRTNESTRIRKELGYRTFLLSQLCLLCPLPLQRKPKDPKVKIIHSVVSGHDVVDINRINNPKFDS